MFSLPSFIVCGSPPNTEMSRINLKDQLLSQGVNHFAIISGTGQVIEYSGDFENKEKQLIAYAIVEQCAALLGPGETLKRVTMVFDDVVYTATTVADVKGTISVVTKRPASTALANGG